MAYEFKLPDLGEGVVEGEIVKWLVGVGEPVAEDQPLVEIMTDKASVEIPSPQAGRVVSLEGQEGDIVSVGQTLIVIDAAAGPSEPKRGARQVAEHALAPAKRGAKRGARQVVEPALAPAKRGARQVVEPSAATPPARLEGGLPVRTTSPLAGHILPSTAPQPSSAASPEGAAGGAAAAAGGARHLVEGAAGVGQVLASPALRKQAREAGVDLSRLQGSGPGGRILTQDLSSGGGMAASAKSASKSPVFGSLPPGIEPPPVGGERRVPLKGVRRAIAKAMQHSKNTAAHFTFVEEVDMRALAHMRASLKGPAAERGVSLTYLPFFVKATVEALKKHPQLNCSLDEATNEIVYRGYYNIGIAAATDRGLMVPVIHQAQDRSLFEIAAEVARLAEATRAGKAKLQELQGSTFTITSLGAQGGLFATPVINYPEVAIMGIHQIKEKPIVENGQIVVGKVMLLSLSFDHRVVDGHIGAAFCYELIALLENPERLFLDAL